MTAARPLTGAVPELAFAVADAGALRARRGADAALRPARRRARAREPIRSVLLDDADPDRGAPARATTRRRTSGCSSCSATSRAGARRCARCCGRGVDASSCRRSRAARVVDAARAVHLRPRGARVALPRRARRTARCRSSSCSAAPSSTRAPDGRLQTGADLLGAGGRVPAAGARVARDDGPHFPGSAWLRLRREHLRPRCAPTGRATRCRAGRRRVDALLDGGGREPWTRCARSPTPCSTRATCCGPTGARR